MGTADEVIDATTETEDAVVEEPDVKATDWATMEVGLERVGSGVLEGIKAVFDSVMVSTPVRACPFELVTTDVCVTTLCSGVSET